MIFRKKEEIIRFIILCDTQQKKSDMDPDPGMVTPAGVEPAIFWMRTRRPNH